MAWWLWVLIGAGILASCLYAIVVLIGVAVLRLKPGEVARELQDGETGETLGRVEEQAGLAADRGWELASVIEMHFLGSPLQDVAWEIESGARYLIGSARGEENVVTSFLTVLRSRSSREQVILVTANHRSIALDMPHEGYLAEAFHGTTVAELERRHELAMRYLFDTGMCELHDSGASPLELYTATLEMQIRWLRKPLFRVILLPLLYLHAVMIRAGRSIEQRYGLRSKTLRRLRGEIMDWPRSFG
ncbi:MAG: hypothetical protein ACFCBV_01100 [Phycisphaerales bacterium]